jgi:hypothetical protein
VCAAAQRLEARRHKNLLLAHRAEAWVIERVSDLVNRPALVERALEYAHRKCEGQLEPEKERLSLTNAALQENQGKIEEMLSAITSGHASGALLGMLNEKAEQLKWNRRNSRPNSAA